VDDTKRKKLEAQGYWVGDAADFVGLKPHERALLDLRLRLRKGVKAARAMNGLTQTQVAKAMGSTQARVAKAESEASGEVSVETLIRALYAAGGSVTIQVSPADEPRASPSRPRRNAARKRGKGGSVVSTGPGGNSGTPAGHRKTDGSTEK
jgi:predicted XRE-type DNA-binding protein